ncbi:MAG TPA: M1 family metallopeptidase [Puia sp.]|nr:M1 family metallopeptidase [Puia sp.]
MPKLLLRTLTIIALLPFARLTAQPYNPAIDVQHYNFQLWLNDSSDRIRGDAGITLEFREPANEFHLDLTGKNADGKGMTVTSVREGDKPVPFTQQDDQLILHAGGAPGSSRTYLIDYEGIPADGLIISKNKFGSRGFFGDNWPNRAHNWLPCVDDPSDKATLDFSIVSPDHYTVVANGALQEEKPLANHLKLTRWKESEPIAPKIMVIGVADFAVDHPGDAMGIPVWNYVYRQNKEAGFRSYAVALDILPFYITHIGPYPFEKEGNVQSKTRFGGLENASAIFYYEGSVGSPGVESLMAHEIAHQWFGDAATETAWRHLWLSEGFATYMTLCYLENKYGPDTLRTSLRKDRAKVIAFEKRRFTPVVDTGVHSDYMQLLNPNSYEKGGWALHMLRRTLGDATFWKGISAYYSAYRNKNASSANLERIMDSVSNKDLREFFHEWLDIPGHPHVTISWKYDPDKRSLAIDFTQHDHDPKSAGAAQSTNAATANPIPSADPLFIFPLEYSVDGTLHHVDIHDRLTHVDIPLPQKPSNITPDPNTNLLADFEVTER